MSLLKLWFGLSAPVDRRSYLWSGIGLMLLRCVGDTLILWAQAGSVKPSMLDPALYISPSMTHRVDIVQAIVGSSAEAHVTVGLMALWALPFAWIGLTMSIRRARDAGLAQWQGLGFLVPVLNILLIAALCAVPSRAPDEPQPTAALLSTPSLLNSSMFAIGLSACFGVALAICCIFLLGDYGYTLFVAGPVIIGAIGGWHVNHRVYHGYKAGFLVAIFSAAVCFMLMLLLALEGVVCMVMLAPLACALVLMGSAIGTNLAKAKNTAGPVGAMVIALPMIGLVETQMPAPLPVYQMVSEIVIDAPPEEVWPNVIGFSELPPASDWVLKTGIATPMRARIEGEGVGAVRYCEFTTGPFVEPITRWEPPYRLAFDVSEQPEPMHEWSPWEEVYAPHLQGTMVSQRGEFQLHRTESGGTRLMGTTWYTLDISPGPYWSMWSDFVVHRIHMRVLNHIKQLSEPA